MEALEEIAVLKAEVQIARKILLDAQARLAAAEKAREAEQKALEKAKWEETELKPLLECEGKFLTSCDGRQWIWVKRIINLEKIAENARQAWPNVDWHMLNPEYEGFEIYFAEKAYSDWRFGRWDYSNGGTIFVPHLWKTSDGRPGVLEECTREEFMAKWLECKRQKDQLDTKFNECFTPTNESE